MAKHVREGRSTTIGERATDERKEWWRMRDEARVDGCKEGCIFAVAGSVSWSYLLAALRSRQAVLL